MVSSKWPMRMANCEDTPRAMKKEINPCPFVCLRAPSWILYRRLGHHPAPNLQDVLKHAGWPCALFERKHLL
jgi:hypothetical protein